MTLRLMSHLQFHHAILSHNFITPQSCSMQQCTSHSATLSHKQELTNQHSQHTGDSCTEYTQNTALLYSEKNLCDLKSCATCHVTLAIFSRDKAARYPPQATSVRNNVQNQQLRHKMDFTSRTTKSLQWYWQD